jgi:sulfate permease, SulP family
MGKVDRLSLFSDSSEAVLNRKRRFLPVERLAHIKLQAFLPNVVGGLTLGLMEAFFAISFASLIFTGRLESELGRGSTLVLVSAAIFFIGIGIFTSLKGSIGSTQDITTVLLAVMISGTLASIPRQAAIPTALILIIISTITTGLALLAVGWLRLGGLIRYIPYPVIGGFLAATGWLLVSGAFPILTTYNLNFENLPRLFQIDQLILWLPAMAAAVLLIIVMRLVKHPLAMPAVLIAAVALFYIVLAVLDIPIEAAVGMGLFFPPSTSTAWQPLGLSELALIEWQAVLAQTGNLIVLMGMTLVGLTLNLSAVELALGREFDLNRELRITGGVNLVSGMAGGVIGYHALAFSIISKRMQATGRVASVVAGFVCLLVVFSGFPLLMYMPKFLIGGMLLFLGLDFLSDWLWSGLSRFAAVEYAIVVMILAAIVMTNFFTGVVLGLLAMVVMFVVSYSRTSAVLRSYSSAEMRSTVGRTSSQCARLEQNGDQVFVMELQGFLFFGTANTMYEEVRLRAADANRRRLTYLLLDFRQVTGIDSSTVLSFRKIQRLASDLDFQLILSGLSKTIRKRLQIDQAGSSGQVIVCQDLDHGLEWCENQLLTGDPSPQPVNMASCLLAAGIPAALTDRMATYLIEMQIPAGEAFIRRDQPSDDMFILLEGQVTVSRKLSNGQLARARTLGPGSVIGEIGVYLGTMRTASVAVDQPARMLRVTRQALQLMQDQDPDLAIAFHQMIVRLLAERLLQEDRSLWALRR